MITEEERAVWLSIRQAKLTEVDAIERYLHIAPRTAELKRQGRDRLQEALRDLEKQAVAK